MEDERHSYDVSTGHGLRHDPLKAIVAPRPIGWISTLSAKGVPNLAPYSFFNLINDRPPMLMFCSSGYKDSVRNIGVKHSGVASSRPAITRFGRISFCSGEPSRCTINVTRQYVPGALLPTSKIPRFADCLVGRETSSPFWLSVPQPLSRPMRERHDGLPFRTGRTHAPHIPWSLWAYFQSRPVLLRPEPK